MMGALAKARRVPDYGSRTDPLTVASRQLERFPQERDRVDREVSAEIEAAVATALSRTPEAEDA
jgi:hypothetical protein